MDRHKLQEEFTGCSHDVLYRNDHVSSSSLPFCTQENWQNSVLVLSQVSQSLFHRNQESPYKLGITIFNKMHDFFAQKLKNLGYPSPTTTTSGGEDGERGGDCGGDSEPRFDVVSLVNTSWSMLQSYRSCLKVISDMEDRVSNVIFHKFSCLSSI